MGRRPRNKEMERKQKVKERPRVLDTSVVVKWFSFADEKDLEKSLMLRQEHVENPGLFVIPDLLYYELANALRYNPRFSLKDVAMAMDSLFKLNIETKSVSSESIRTAVSLAFEKNITVYDACFLALAQELDGVLITADLSFFKKTESGNFVRRLSDL